jgi:hypothetical protein
MFYDDVFKAVNGIDGLSIEIRDNQIQMAFSGSLPLELLEEILPDWAIFLKKFAKIGLFEVNASIDEGAICLEELTLVVKGVGKIPYKLFGGDAELRKRIAEYLMSVELISGVDWHEEIEGELPASLLRQEENE